MRFFSISILNMLLSGFSGIYLQLHGNNSDSFEMDRFCYKVSSDVIVGKDNSLSWLNAVVTGYTPVERKCPAKIC